MAQTLAAIRANLNEELSVATDAETAPFTVALRNRAISQGYAALWRKGCWKPVQQSIATVTDQSVYSTTIRRLRVVDFLDTAGRVTAHVPAAIELTTTGTPELVLHGTLSTGYTMRVNGWTAYISTFANDAAVDDLEEEYSRIPLLRAKAICYRVTLAEFARYGSRQAVEPAMNLTVDQALGVVAAAEREFEEECRTWRALRPRVMQPRNARQYVG